MKNTIGTLLAGLFIVFVLISLLLVNPRVENSELIRPAKIADSEAGLLEAFLLSKIRARDNSTAAGCSSCSQSFSSHDEEPVRHL